MRRRLGAAALMWIAADVSVRACPVCFQIEDEATADGVRAAVLVLLSVTAVVLSAVGVWWARFARASTGSGLFSTDPATLVPDVGHSRWPTSGTDQAGSVEKRPDPV